MMFHVGLLLSIMILYVFLCHGKKNKKRELIFLRITFLIFFILVASREMTIGNDTPMYINLFKKCARMKWDIINASDYFEAGYLIFNILLSYISSSPRFFMIIMSAIFNFSIYRFIKKNSNNYFLSALMYIGLLFLYTSMTMMRQFLAIIIIISGIRFAKEKRILLFLGVVLLATTIHTSAWLALLIYPIINIRFTDKRAIIIILIGVIASFFMSTIYSQFMNLVGRANYYEQRFGNESIANILYAIIFFTFFILARYLLRKSNKNKEFKGENSFYLYSLLSAALMSIMGAKADIASRAIIYFSIFAIISIPNIITANVLIHNNKKIARLTIILFVLAYSSTIIALRPEWNTAYRYKTCLLPKNEYVCNKT